MPVEACFLHRIAIIGAGQVGGAAAYALVLSSVAKELLLVDIDTDLRDAQVYDLGDAAYSTNRGTSVRAANYQEASQCDIIVLAAGCAHTFGQTTLDRLYRNISIVRNVLNAITPLRQDSILIIASSPCDLLTSLARELSALPASQVIGVGTCLDSLRLRGLLSDHTEVAANSIHINALGVQGPGEVVTWSTATIGGVPIKDWCQSNGTIQYTSLEREFLSRSQSILNTKGSAPFGFFPSATSSQSMVAV
ncbi:hypothetical protein G3M48_008550 [Beauveria asiatica]|uniref:Lactate/malate dehydrogenase N-terminal domain-containing protein n=1 Tax=Beauveria asiatica TaxID=1069075 RepID=A0AAW0RK47_9HYPO